VVNEEDIAFKVIDNDISWDEVDKGDYIIVATYLQPYDGAMALTRVDRSSITVKRLKYRDDKENYFYFLNKPFNLVNSP